MLDRWKLVDLFFEIANVGKVLNAPLVRRRRHRRCVEKVFNRSEDTRVRLRLHTCRRTDGHGHLDRLSYCSWHERRVQAKLGRGDGRPAVRRRPVRDKWTLWLLRHYSSSQLYFPTSGTNRTGAISVCSSLSPLRVNM